MKNTKIQDNYICFKKSDIKELIESYTSPDEILTVLSQEIGTLDISNDIETFLSDIADEVNQETDDDMKCVSENQRDYEQSVL